MFWKKTFIVIALWSWMGGHAFAAECVNPPAKVINLDLASRKSLLSPDQQWRIISVGSDSSEQAATLSIQNKRTSQKWNVGSIERHATAFWSEDSKRLFLRDSYAADDTKIRVFDFSGPRPKEIKGLDESIRKAIFSRIPEDEATQWLYYPKACFAANDTDTIILVADAPLTKKRESSEGKPFKLNLTVNIISFQILIEAPKAPTFP